MVRLKGCSTNAPSRRQFRISIPVWCDWKFHTSDYERFVTTISIPVWCDWKIYPHCYPWINLPISIPVWCDWKAFNFSILFAVADFNSSMVRLKDLLLSIFIVTRLFQFQYGAIERSSCTNSRSSLYISIPVWCDWKDVAVLVITPVEKFQFQYGAIERSEAVAIPVKATYFNSSMVRLKECIPRRNDVNCQHFNSSMVRLKDTDAQLKAKRIEISIPVWCDWKQPSVNN